MASRVNALTRYARSPLTPSPRIKFWLAVIAGGAMSMQQYQAVIFAAVY